MQKTRPEEICPNPLSIIKSYKGFSIHSACILMCIVYIFILFLFFVKIDYHGMHVWYPVI